MATNHVRYTFESTPLSGTTLVTQSVRVVEALNEPYRMEVRFACDDPDTDLSPMLGKDCVLSIRRGESARRVCGLVRDVEEGQRSDYAAGSVVVVPALWMLGLRRNTRIFQEKSAAEILEIVLGEGLGPYGREARLELAESYPRREYCVQYQETDLDFVHRLMEEEGISYGFDHEGDVEVLVLRDRNSAFGELSSGATVPYQPHNFEIDGAEPVNAFTRSRKTTTTSVVIGEWDWTKGTMPFSHEARGTDPLGRDRESYEHGEGRSLALWDYDAGVRAYQANDGPRQATVRREAHVRDATVCRGIGRSVAFEPGVFFELSGHPEVAMDARYLIVRVEHVSRQLGDALEGAGGGDAYHNRFECIPFETTYRPERRAKKPAIAGIQTAVVTGPSGEEIHTDEHGRIKVQFHWDREGNYDDASSCWIRVQQAWAGAGWGFWYLPRVGMEVVVHFVDGDPDRPLVTGCVYNGSNLLPYPLPDEKTKSTIKSNSTPGGGGSNELRFEDKAGSEEIYAHAQKDYNEVVENDHTTLVHNNQTITVDNNQTQTIGANQTETVHGNQEMTVDGNRTVHVKSSYSETVDGTETRQVTGDVSETFDANETRSIGANLTEDIAANETRTLGGNLTETIGGSQTRTVSGSSTVSIMGSLTESILGGVTTDTPATYDITAAGGYTVTAPGGITINAAAGIQVGAPNGIEVVDSFFDWQGNFKPSSGGCGHGLAIIKDEFAGLSMSAAGVKVSGTGVDCSATGNEMKNEGFALGVFLLDLKQGGMEIWSGFRKK